MTKYVWADGARARVKAEVAKRELARIETEEGNLLPRTIVAQARSPRSPLHKCFDWSNRVAGDKWRLMQASQLVLHVRMVLPDDTTPRRVFVGIGYGKGYGSIERVRQDPNLCESIVRQARDEMQEWADRWQDLKEQLSILTETAKVIKRRRKKVA